MAEIRLWRDWSAGWQDELHKLPATAQAQINASLSNLVQALASCTDVLSDPALAEWGPKKWETAQAQRSRGIWAEYHLGDRDNRARVVVCHMVEKDQIHLVARTAVHDHTKLRELVGRFTPR